MRITNQMMTSNLLRNLQKNVVSLARSNEMLSTGKQLTKPSDDPVNIGRAELLRTVLAENEQYQANVSEAISWLAATDSALEQMGNILQKARELAVYGASDTLSGTSREALAKEVDQLLQSALGVANTDHGGRYIFAGFRTKTMPYPGINYVGGPPTDAMNYEVGQGITLRVNVTGEEVFGPNGANVFQVLQDLRDHLQTNNTAAVRNDLGLIDAQMDNILRWRSDVGAKMNRLETTQERLLSQKENVTRLLSEVEDADMAKVIMDLKMQETIYRAALDSGARIIQPTLLDFLR